MGKTLEPDVIRDQAAFLRLALPTKYHDFFDALCRTALRPDSGGEAVREACARVAEKYEPSERHPDVTYASQEIRNLPLPTLPAAEGCEWREVEDDGYWQTGCGQKWTFSAPGTPKEHGMEFCYHCGKRLSAPPAAGDV